MAPRTFPIASNMDDAVLRTYGKTFRFMGVVRLLHLDDCINLIEWIQPLSIQVGLP